MEISMHVIFDEFDDLVINKEDEEEIFRKESENIQEHSPQVLPRCWKPVGDHPPEQII